MRQRSHPTIVVALLGLAAGALACGSSPASPPATATEPPVSAPTRAADVSATVPCSQLIAPDALKLLLNNADATLSDQVNPGTSTCTWNYTPTGSTEPGYFQVEVDYSAAAVETWTAARQSELGNEPAETAVVSITGLGDENYTWVSQPSGQRIIYARDGNKTLIMRFAPDVLFLQSESGIIDYAERIFSHF